MMKTSLSPGDRVQWTEKGVVRTGTVEQSKAWNPYAYVRPDHGSAYPVNKDKLSKIEDGGGQRVTLGVGA